MKNYFIDTKDLHSIVDYLIDLEHCTRIDLCMPNVQPQPNLLLITCPKWIVACLLRNFSDIEISHAEHIRACYKKIKKYK